jgi:CBS domain-containing protein
MEMVARRSVREAPVSEAMSTNVVSVAAQTSLMDLKGVFEQHDFNMLPVMENGRLVGVVTKLDLLSAFVVERTISKANYLNILAEKVEDIMCSTVETVSPNDSIRSAVESMVQNKLRSMPVLDGEHLVGIISRGDVMPYLVFEEG